MAGLGWEFVSYVLAGMLLGWGIDWAWSVAPWGIVGGTVAGLLVGMWTFLKRALKLNAEQGPVQRPPGGWREVPDDEPKPDPDSADDRGQGRQP
jgi:F0F1-type ATP synthase assembly protein I